jgi:hypothetical protein
LVLGATVLASSLVALATPLQRTLLPADVAWWVHVDIDRLKQTEVGRFIFGELDKPEAQARFAAFQAIFNFDPRHNLRACVLYGRGQKPEDAVLLLHGGFDAERLLTLARAGQNYQSTPHRHHAVHGWTDRKHAAQEGEKPRRYGAIHPGGWVVMGQTQTRVTEALDVLDGLTPSLASSNDFSQWTVDTSQTAVLAAARRIEGLDADPRAAFLKHSSQYSLAIGETGAALFAEVCLTTNDEATAEQVCAIVHGLKALVTLKRDDPNAAKIASGLSIAQTGAQVVISLQLASAEVVQALQDAAAKHRP